MSAHWDHIASVLGFDPRRIKDGIADPARPYPQRDGVRRRLQELRTLPDGWDGYRGRAVTERTAARVHAVLSACLSPTGRYPSIVPGPSGDVQVEWHWGGVDLELGISGDDQSITAWSASGTSWGLSETFEFEEALQC